MTITYRFFYVPLYTYYSLLFLTQPLSPPPPLSLSLIFLFYFWQLHSLELPWTRNRSVQLWRPERLCAVYQAGAGSGFTGSRPSWSVYLRRMGICKNLLLNVSNIKKMYRFLAVIAILIQNYHVIIFWKKFLHIYHD